MENSPKRSSCYDRLQRYISQEFEKLENEHLVKGNFFKDHEIKDKRPNGTSFNNGGHGMAYESTAQQIFWHPAYIPAYIEEIFDSCLVIISKTSKEFFIHPNKCNEELEILFFPKIDEIYQKMSVIDSRLRGNGINIPPPIDTSEYTNILQDNIKERLARYKLGIFQSTLWWLSWPLWIIRNLMNLGKSIS